MKYVLNRIRQLNLIQTCGWLFILLGVILRLRQYLANRSLWVDEASLALNIVNRTYSELIRPLDYDQGAPLGFLYAVKLMTQIFGNQDYVLRIIPLLSGILALYLMYRIASEYFGVYGLAALGMFSLSGSMITYSSELKQYSCDVLFALLLTYFTLRYIEGHKDWGDLFKLGIIGAIAVWMSHPVVFELAVIGIVLVADKFLRKSFESIYRLIGVGVAWAGSFLATYLISLHHLIGNNNLQDYWQSSFAPIPPWEDLGWYRNVLISLLPQVNPSFFPYVIQNYQPSHLFNVCLFLMLLGCVYLLWRNWGAAILITLPILLMFFASSLQLYPISERFLYFWFPALLFLLAEGMRLVHSLLNRFNTKAALAVYGLLALTLFWSSIAQSYEDAVNPPMGEDIKPVLAYLREHIEPGDILYIHHGSITPYLYYESEYGLNAGEIFIAYKSYNFKRFMIDAENFRGSDRIWFVFSHVTSCDCDGDLGLGERVLAHVRILDEKGSQMDHFEASRAYAYLYDLSP